MQKHSMGLEPTPLHASQIAVSHSTNCATKAALLMLLSIINLNYNIMFQSKEWCALAYT